MQYILTLKSSGILHKGKAAKHSHIIRAPDLDDELFLPTRVSSPKASKEKQGFDSNSHVLTDEETDMLLFRCSLLFSHSASR